MGMRFTQENTLAQSYSCRIAIRTIFAADLNRKAVKKMRLIDADCINFYKATVARGTHSFDNVEIVEKFQIDRMPTIDPEILRPRWIPVTERLPVEAKKVLCFLALSGGQMVETGYYMGDEGWYYTGIEAPHHGIVTHWMPLPEPPEVS